MLIYVYNSAIILLKVILMFIKILNKANSNYSKIAKKVERMNLTDMRIYVNNKILQCPLSKEGLNEVMKKLISKDEKTLRRFIETDDMDSKIKKAFELVLLIGKNKKITSLTVKFILDFMKIYIDIIRQYDTQYKEIYASRFVNIVNSSIQKFDGVTQEESKMMLMSHLQTQ